MKYDQVKEQLDQLTPDSQSKIEILHAISLAVNRGQPEWEGRDLVIRALDKFHCFDEVETSLLLSMIRAVGLYPYITPYLQEVSLADRLAYEVHRVDGLEKGMVFHRLQAHVFSLLMQGRNVVLSATTSVGKSLVIDAILAQSKFHKVVVIVPTIALIDETRRRLVRRFKHTCNIITHPTQESSPSLTNVYLLTQERVLQRDDLEDVGFFVVDEFYKLDLASDSQDGSRAIDLSLAFHKLACKGSQFYLLGPHIQHIQGLDAYEYNFIPSNFATVAVDVEHFNSPSKGEARNEKLVELCRKIQTPTLIYCQSPASANRVAELLIKRSGLTPIELTQDISGWIAANYHPEWNVAKAISLGIGIHHGGVPRARQQYFVKLFNEGTIKHIICTSTMIEGVNTAAENVIIFDRRISSTPFDFFTFKNISGRAGRMNRYFIGKVYMLEAPPIEEDLTVDYPIGLQSETSPMGLLMKLEPEYLTELSRQRLDSAYATPLLSPTTLIENRHVPVERQLEIAARIIREMSWARGLLTWRGNPERNQLEYVCDLVCEHLETNLMDYGISLGSHLAVNINALRMEKNFTAYLQNAIDHRKAGSTPSEAIGRRLKFIRNVVCYNLPRDFMVVSRIQADVLSRRGIEPGDFTFFAEQLENLFHDPLLTALDEYGIPTQISMRIKNSILPSENLNDLLSKLRKMAGSLHRLPLSAFERRLVEWAIAEM